MVECLHSNTKSVCNHDGGLLPKKIHADLQLLHVSRSSSSCIQPWAWTAAHGFGVSVDLPQAACIQSVRLTVTAYHSLGSLLRRLLSSD